MAVANRGHKAIIKDGENGFLVPLNNPAAMAERVIEIMGNKQLYERLSNVDVEKYQCESIAKTIYNYLCEVMNAR